MQKEWHSATKPLLFELCAAVTYSALRILILLFKDRKENQFGHKVKQGWKLSVTLKSTFQKSHFTEDVSYGIRRNNLHIGRKNSLLNFCLCHRTEKGKLPLERWSGTWSWKRILPLFPYGDAAIDQSPDSCPCGDAFNQLGTWQLTLWWCCCCPIAWQLPLWWRCCCPTTLQMFLRWCSCFPTTVPYRRLWDGAVVVQLPGSCPCGGATVAQLFVNFPVVLLLLKCCLTADLVVLCCPLTL